MIIQNLSSMRVVLANSDLGGRIDVPLDSFMQFDLEMNRSLQQLESRWELLHEELCIDLPFDLPERP